MLLLFVAEADENLDRCTVIWAGRRSGDHFLCFTDDG